MTEEKTTTTTTTRTTYRQPTMRGYSYLEPTSGASILDLTGNQAMLRMPDAVVETKVIHTTRTTTSFQPIPIPRIPEPTQIPIPWHLTESYPLARVPVPEDMRSFALNLSGRKVVVGEDCEEVGTLSEAPYGSRGPGWVKQDDPDVFDGKLDRIDVAEALQTATPARDIKGKGKASKRPYTPRAPSVMSMSPDTVMADDVPSPPATATSYAASLDEPVVRSRSPPRKRSRVLQGLTSPPIPDPPTSALLSPLPSPGAEQNTFPSASLSESQVVQPSLGSGLEAAALFSLPAVVKQFDSLPDKLQQHVLMHLFRRSRMPTIQRLSAFASQALKRDFISLLPHEIAVQILKKVDVKGLVAASAVCKKWRRIVEGERAVWRQRLIDDGLWYGFGAEEEAEEAINRRFDTMDLIAEDEASEPPNPERPTALKHVYRRRKVNNDNWLHRRPEHHSFLGHGTNVVTCLQFDADKIVSASDDHSINIYETQTGHLRKRLSGHEGGVWALEYKGDTLVSGSTDRTVRVWDLETLKEEHVFAGHSSTVRCLQIVEPVMDPLTGEFQPPYPVIVTGSRDTSLRVWKLPKKGEPAYRIVGSPGAPAEHVSPEENPYHVHLLEGHTGAVRALAAHGRVCVSGSYDNTVRVWDIVSGTCSHVLTGHETKVYSIVYDRWRKQCASGSMDNTVKVWDVVNGTCLHTLEGHSSLVGLLGISPSYLVSAAADASLKVWDADTGTINHTLTSHSGAITCFQHDESKVVSGSDGALKLWDVKTGAFVRDLVTNISSVWQVEFSGSRLVAASARSNGTVFDVFDFGPLNDPSGVDDDDLDLCVRPAWERGDPREPLQYQQLADGQVKLGRTSFTSNDSGKRTRKYLRQAATTAGAATTTPLRRTRLRGECSLAGSSRNVPIMPANETSPTPNPSSFAPIFDETLDELSDDDVEMS